MENEHPPVQSAFAQSPAAKSTGLAIAALVCGIVGLFCFPSGIAGIILGIVALTRASTRPDRYGGNGMAIAGIVTGAVAMCLSATALFAGILLPALGKARQNAMQLRSGTQLRAIGEALRSYQADYQSFPETGADIADRLTSLSLASEGMFVTPWADDSTGRDSYIICPNAGTDLNSATVWIFENPAISTRGINVLFSDGHVEYIPSKDIESTLADVREAWTLDGRPYKRPAGPHQKN